MICALVLAAGESRRMGRQKMLLPFGGTTAIAHITDEILQSAIDKVLVVVGHDADRVADALAAQRAAVVVNPDYRAGMLSSIRCGLQALPETCESVLVALGDQPTITAGLVDELLLAFRATDKGILVPLHNGRRGHPILFSMQYREEILRRFDGEGLRGLLHAHPEDIAEVPVATPSVLLDMNYPEDYRRTLASLRATRDDKQRE